MHIIGLVGGVAAGKSLVADCFARLSAEVLCADAAAHEVLRIPEIIQRARERWGEDILDADGQIKRAALAQIVFAPPPAGPTERAALESWIHPRIRDQFEARIGELAREDRCPAVVIDAPLLLEAGWAPLCDRIVFVDAERDIRRLRTRARGWSEHQFAAREAAQLPIDRKRAAAHIVIDNSGSPQETCKQVEAFWRDL
jgi:dephospho-CoA kinase